MFLCRFDDIPAHSISVRRIRFTLTLPDLNCLDGYTVSTSERYQQIVILLIEQVEKLHINTAHAHCPCALDMHSHLVQNAFMIVRFVSIQTNLNVYFYGEF